MVQLISVRNSSYAVPFNDSYDAFFGTSDLVMPPKDTFPQQNGWSLINTKPKQRKPDCINLRGMAWDLEN